MYTVGCGFEQGYGVGLCLKYFTFYSLSILKRHGNLVVVSLVTDSGHRQRSQTSGEPIISLVTNGWLVTDTWLVTDSWLVTDRGYAKLVSAGRCGQPVHTLPIVKAADYVQQ